MRIVFLDIDGVLVTDRSLRESTSFPPRMDVDALKIFNDFIEDADLDIVISSSWRLSKTWVADIFEASGRSFPMKRVVGKTPVLDTTRGEEIAQWLRGKKVERFIIVDDDDDFLPGQPLVKTDMERGFCKESVELALQLLGEKR